MEQISKINKNKKVVARHDGLASFADYNYQKTIKITEQSTKTKKKKTSWIFLIINVVIVAGIFIYQFCFGETKPLSELFAERPYYRFFSISLGAIALFYLLYALGYSIMLKITTGKFNFWLGLQLGFVGKYWDSITPFGSGGQFAQIAHGIKKGVSQEDTTSIVVGKYMISMLAFVVLGIVALFIPMSTFTSGIVIKVLAGVGVGINLLLTLFIWLVSINRKLCSVIVFGGIKLLHKMHIIKNYNRAVFKSMRFIKQYQKAFRYLIKKPWAVIAQLFICILEWLTMAVIAYLIYLAFNFPNLEVGPVPIMAMSILCTFATSYFPIPGGSGMAEVSFAALFAKLFTDGTNFWALILWRVFTYYIFIIIGFIFTFADSFVTKREVKKQASKEQEKQF